MPPETPRYGTGLEAGADAIVFIDDDEWPDVDWLAELIATQRATGADVVTGPVMPVFDDPAPTWVLAGGFFDRPRFPHNSTIPYATTSSVLMTRSLFRRAYRSPSIPISGCPAAEDTHLFAELSMPAHAWHGPTARSSTRRFPASRVDTIVAGSPRVSAGTDAEPIAPAAATRRVSGSFGGSFVACSKCLGIGGGVVGVVGGKHRRVRRRPAGRFGAGMITGLLDRRYDEYRTIHGR